jgi:hypothetical protein
MLGVLEDHGLRRTFQHRSRIWQVAGLERVREGAAPTRQELGQVRPAYDGVIPRESRQGPAATAVSDGPERVEETLGRTSVSQLLVTSLVGTSPRV